MNEAIKHVSSVIPFSPVAYTWAHITPEIYSKARNEYDAYIKENNIPYYADGSIKDLPLPLQPVAVLLEVQNVPEEKSHGLVVTIDKPSDDALIFAMWSERKNVTMLVTKDFSGESQLKIHPQYIKQLERDGIDLQKAGQHVSEMFETMLRVVLLLGCKNTIISKAGIYRCKGDKVKNAKRLRKGKRPFWEWETIEIKQTRTLPSAPQGGTHASPKPHERMGHWRSYKSGKRIFVKPHIVNKHKIPEEGYIFHDYIKGKSNEILGVR